MWRSFVEALVAALLRASRPLFADALRPQRSWRTCPLAQKDLWRAGLRPTTQVAYEKALHRFTSRVQFMDVQLDVACDVDAAAAAFVMDLPRSQAELTLAALERRYPL